MLEEQELVVPGRQAPALDEMLNADGSMKTNNAIAPIPDEELAAAAGIDSDSESEEEPESESDEVVEEVDPNEIVEITDENLVGKTPDELAKMVKDNQSAYTRSQQELADARRQLAERDGSGKVDVADILPVPATPTAEQQQASTAQRQAALMNIYLEELKDIKALNPDVDVYREDPDVPTAAEAVAWKRANQTMSQQESLIGAQTEWAIREIPVVLMPAVAETLKDFPLPGITATEIAKAVLAENPDVLNFMGQWKQVASVQRTEYLKGVAYKVYGKKAADAKVRPVTGPVQTPPKTGGTVTENRGGKITLTASQKAKVDKAMELFPGMKRADAIKSVKRGNR
jgi:hypothetical protein